MRLYARHTSRNLVRALRRVLGILCAPVPAKFKFKSAAERAVERYSEEFGLLWGGKGVAYTARQALWSDIEEGRVLFSVQVSP